MKNYFKYFQTRTFDEKFTFSEQAKKAKETYFISQTHAYWWLKSHTEEEKIFFAGKAVYLKIANLYFKVVFRGEELIFPFSDVLHVRYVHHKLLLPLLFGCISTPLFFLSLLKEGIFNNWTALLWVLVSAVFFTVGLQGRKRIEVVTAGRSYYYECNDSEETAKTVAKLNQMAKK